MKKVQKEYNKKIQMVAEDVMLVLKEKMKQEGGLRYGEIKDAMKIVDNSLVIAMPPFSVKDQEDAN